MKKYLIILYILVFSTSIQAQYYKSVGSRFISFNASDKFGSLAYSYQTSHSNELRISLFFSQNDLEPFIFRNIGIQLDIDHSFINFLESYYIVPRLGLMIANTSGSDNLNNKVNDISIGLPLSIDCQAFLSDRISINFLTSEIYYFKSKFYNFLFTYSLGIKLRI